ncbi:MAG: hypothetical protein ABL927_12695 [Bdellovibrionales bacterium]
MVKRKLITNVTLLISAIFLSACPGENPKANNAFPNQQQTLPPGSGMPITPIDSSIKSFQCEFEAQRHSGSRFFNSSVSIPKTIAVMTSMGNYEHRFDLRTKFLGMDFGKFGSIYLKYIPASIAKKTNTDTIVLVDEGLNKNIRMSQSGFAGQEVKLEAQDNGMFVSIACKGAAISQFKSESSTGTKTNLVCKGKSSTATSLENEFESTFPLNSIHAGVSFDIADGLSAKLDSTASTITYIGDVDPDYAPLIFSTASLKSSATFRIATRKATNANAMGEINVTCRVQ